MAFHKAKEEYKWKRWKEKEEEQLRKSGIPEESIQKLRQLDWEDFKEERRYREHQAPFPEYLELLMEERQDVASVENLLDSIEDERLFQCLLDTDMATLQILLLKMMGFSIKEISRMTGMCEQTIYTKKNRLRKKLKKFFPK